MLMADSSTRFSSISIFPVSERRFCTMFPIACGFGGRGRRRVINDFATNKSL
jgi:hypothetical protein